MTPKIFKSYLTKVDADDDDVGILLLPLALQPTVGFGLSKNVLPFFLSATNSLHLLTPSTWRSLSTSSFHLFLCLPLLLVPSSSRVKIFWGILSSSILSRWPNQLILYDDVGIGVEMCYVVRILVAHAHCDIYSWYLTFKHEAQTALFKDQIRTALLTLYISFIKTNQFVL